MDGGNRIHEWKDLHSLALEIERVASRDLERFKGMVRKAGESLVKKRRKYRKLVDAAVRRGKGTNPKRCPELDWEWEPGVGKRPTNTPGEVKVIGCWLPKELTRRYFNPSGLPFPIPSILSDEEWAFTLAAIRESFVKKSRIPGSVGFLNPFGPVEDLSGDSPALRFALTCSMVDSPGFFGGSRDEEAARRGLERVRRAMEARAESGSRGVGKGMKWQDVLKLAEEIVKKEYKGVMPPVKTLAKRIGCATNTLYKAKENSSYLSARYEEMKNARGSEPKASLVPNSAFDRLTEDGREVERLMAEQNADMREDVRRSRPERKKSLARAVRA